MFAFVEASGRGGGLDTVQLLEERVKIYESVAKVNTVSSNLNISDFFQMRAHIYTDTHSQGSPNSPSSNLSEELNFVKIYLRVAHTCRETLAMAGKLILGGSSPVCVPALGVD